MRNWPQPRSPKWVHSSTNTQVTPLSPTPSSTHTNQPPEKWSAAIASYDGYVFVSPEYNYGVPGSAKNAIDYLYNDWIGKPILIVTYGIFGGHECNKALNTILKAMKLRVIPTSPELKFAEGQDQAFSAMGGTIAEKTLKQWEDSEHQKDLLKGFEELVEELEKPVAAK
jgi:NAD(P)H-dependent FMN reductase